MEILNIILIIFIVSSALFGIASFFITAYVLFSIHLKRSKPEKWGRECSSDDPIQVAMYNEGLEWGEENEAFKKDVHIVNEGMNLYGEYFDFGYDKAVIMVPGRTEGLRYGYFFASVYKEKGYNVLAIDQRAHGKSDGKYNTIGFEEHKDIISWAEFIHEKFCVKSIVLHGICIGASCSMFALVSDKCPSYLIGMVGEGIYPDFWESFKNHMIALKKPVEPFITLVNMWMKLFTGYTMKFGPKNVIDKMDKALLMIHGKEDLYSLPCEAEKLYEMSIAKPKNIVWVEKGAHSQLRHADKEKYDNAVRIFLDKIAIKQ
ncbi:MAG: alpha/beta hydrolase [Ruminococcaceae bacterium]|nr:alpha/beta hydrolase [Oscillospiraceae bacterium]